MAKILVYSLSNINLEGNIKPISFVESFCNVLSRMGNTVKHCCTKPIATYQKDVDKSRVLNDIKKYNPDLIISFNNVFPVNGVLNVTDCPIVLFLSDTPAFIQNKHLMREYKERYYFFGSSIVQTSSLKEWFPDIADERIILFGHATDLRAKKIVQDINISFVGAIGNWDTFFISYFKQLYSILKNNNYDFGNTDLQKAKDDFFEMVENFKRDPLKKDLGYKLPHFYNISDDIIEQHLIALVTSNIRFGYLHELADLGLKIFSYPMYMPDTMSYDYKLFQAYQYKIVATFADTEDIYNRSVISLTLPHAQAKDGISWRVCDILASNAVLLSNRQKDLLDLMKGYADIPTYTSEAEAKELATKFLNDSSYRNDIILASHSMIEDKCRFEPKFRKMSEVLNIPLDLPAETTKTVEFTDPYNYISRSRIDKTNKKYNKPLKKLYFYKKIIDKIESLPTQNWLTRKIHKKALSKYSRMFYKILPPPNLW